LMVFVGAFGLQWGIGAAVDAFAAGGMARPDAFRVTFAALLAVQGLAFAWFLVPVKRVNRSRGMEQNKSDANASIKAKI
ncbi:MAG: hypothetical protein JJD98_06185, partial [Polaromonas sp.]|nr:hypothetical protein [Polaromonas sp.]